MSTMIDWPTRFAEMITFVEFTEEDRQRVKTTSPLILAEVRRLNNEMYDHLLTYPQSRKFFVTDDDEPDEKRIEDNKQTMISWLRAASAAPSNEGFIRFLVGISQMHKNTPIHRPGLGPVPPRYIIGVISFYQTQISNILNRDLEDAEEARQASVAWSKWLMVGMEPLLASYLIQDPEDT